MERTFVLIKPDAVKRKLIGEIVSRFERAGLEISALKMLNATPEIVAQLYPNTEDWLRSVGNKMSQTYQTYKKDIVGEMGTSDTLELGRMVREWLIDYITSSPVVAMILVGNHAVDVARKLIGNTNPVLAEPGTIRGDLSIDSADYANPSHRAIYNLVHASGSLQEAEYEISLWFGT